MNKKNDLPRMISPRTVWLLVLLAFFCSAAAYADDILEFTVHSEKTIRRLNEKKEETKKQETSDTVLKVVLGKDYFSYSEGDRQEIYDLKKRRIFTIDRKENIYNDESLFMNIGFRSMELRNRQAMEAAFKAIKFKGATMRSAQPFAEHLFSIPDEGSGPKISESTDKGAVSFRSEGTDLMSWSLDGVDVSEAEMRQFVKFFRYHFGGHPMILKRMAANGKVPRSLKMNRYDLGEDETILITLTSFNKSSDAPYDLGGLKPGVFSEDTDGLSKTIYRVRYEPPGLYKKRADDVLKNAEEDFSKGRYFESFLGYMEYGFQTGRISEAMKRKGSDLRGDENVKKYMAATASLTEGQKEAEKALAVLQRLLDLSTAHKQVIMAQEGEFQARLGNSAEAKRLWLAALEIDPYLVTVYMDLGRAYYREYNTLQAWRCWDLGRKLAPGYEASKDVDDLEKKLLTEYPDFF
jgi:hypothetical protein